MVLFLAFTVGGIVSAIVTTVVILLILTLMGRRMQPSHRQVPSGQNSRERTKETVHAVIRNPSDGSERFIN